MAQRKRQYGSGCLLKKKGGWQIRWRETEISPDGTRRRVLRFETLGKMSRREANSILAQRVATASTKVTKAPSTMTFRSWRPSGKQQCFLHTNIRLGRIGCSLRGNT